MVMDVNFTKLAALPLPSATVVVDLRGSNEQNIIEPLQVEIEDIAHEMKLREISHWRYLADFLAFVPLPPLSDDELAQLQHTKKPPSKKVSANSIFPPVIGKDVSGFTGDPQSEIFQNRDKELIHKINTVRHNRIKAVSNLPPTGGPGNHANDPTVRVLFITDLDEPNALASASAYAVRIKEHFPASSGALPMIRTAMICLNSSDKEIHQADLAAQLSWEGKWDHLDLLMITEKYGEDGRWMDAGMQVYWARLLTYVLLLIPALMPDRSNADEESAEDAATFPKKDASSFPPTFLIGVAAMEHSARWGRHFVNSGLVEETVNILLEIQPEDEKRTAQASRDAVNFWIPAWWIEVSKTLSDRALTSLPGLGALPRAKQAAIPDEKALVQRRLSLNAGKIALANLQHYLSRLLETYLTSSTSPTVNVGLQALPEEQAPLPPTLKDTLESVEAIKGRIKEAEISPPAKPSPLAQVLVAAQQVLVHKKFFAGAHGAIPRAQRQLKDVGDAIGKRQKVYDETVINLEQKQRALRDDGVRRISDLANYANSWPFLQPHPGARTVVAWLTLLGPLFLLWLFAVLTGYAYLHHIVTLQAPDFLPTIDSPLMVALGILILLFILFPFWRYLLGDESTALRVEVTLIVSLVALGILGLLITFPFNSLANDMPDLFSIAWPTALLEWLSYGVLALALVLAVLEVAHFFQWTDDLFARCKETIAALQHAHLGNVAEVEQYIIDTIALQMLQRAELTDGKGNTGQYHERIVTLKDLLSGVRQVSTMQTDGGGVKQSARDQHELARSRLETSLSEMQPDTPPEDRRLNLQIREELLDVAGVVKKYNDLVKVFRKNDEETRDFAEVLLRAMGVESPAQIEFQMRERPQDDLYRFSSREEHHYYALVLMATVVATLLRFLIAEHLVESIDPLKARYNRLASAPAYQLSALGALIASLEKSITEKALQPASRAVSSRKEKTFTKTEQALATKALGGWVEMVWEYDEEDLAMTLSPDGVMPKLAAEGFDEKVVRRLLALRANLPGKSSGSTMARILLLPPLARADAFLKKLEISKNDTLDFPDVERLIWMYIQRYAVEQLLLTNPTPKALPEGQSGADADTAGTHVQNDQNSE